MGRLGVAVLRHRLFAAVLSAAIWLVGSWACHAVDSRASFEGYGLMRLCIGYYYSQRRLGKPLCGTAWLSFLRYVMYMTST